MKKLVDLDVRVSHHLRYQKLTDGPESIFPASEKALLGRALFAQAIYHARWSCFTVIVCNFHIKFTSKN
jgi:hypothetical protein